MQQLNYKHMQKINLKINGMHCSSCEKIITAELSELPGAVNIKIDALAGTGSLEIDESKVSLEQIRSAVKTAGYEVTAINTEDIPVAQNEIIVKQHTVDLGRSEEHTSELHSPL